MPTEKEKELRKIARVMRDMTPVFALVMCLHCGLLLCGINCVVCEVLLGLLVFHVLWYSSKRIGLCSLHRQGLLYGYSVFFCCSFERAIGFGVMLTPMRWLMFVLGIAITYKFVGRAVEIKRKHNYHVCTKYK